MDDDGKAVGRCPSKNVDEVVDIIGVEITLPRSLACIDIRVADLRAVDLNLKVHCQIRTEPKGKAGMAMWCPIAPVRVELDFKPVPQELHVVAMQDLPLGLAFQICWSKGPLDLQGS